MDGTSASHHATDPIHNCLWELRRIQAAACVLDAQFIRTKQRRLQQMFIWVSLCRAPFEAQNETELGEESNGNDAHFNFTGYHDLLISEIVQQPEDSICFFDR